MAMDVDMEAGAAMAATEATMAVTTAATLMVATPMVGTMAEATILMCMVTTAGTECCKKAARSV